MSRSETARQLKAWALELGFDRAGVARLGPAETGPAFLEWLDRGDHAGMDYLSSRSAERLDPRELLDGASSAVCVALQYAPQKGEAADGDLWPAVARYARGRDYHGLMTKRLRKLAQRVRTTFPGADAKPYVDTGPVLERELAAAAGIGVFGKNTMLLHPEAGSWFFIGELLTTLDLEPDVRLSDLCGTCTSCLEACPTGAFPAPYRLDSNRCISYWTIEHRGEIPAKVRGDVGDWVFGCDICQEACPWNDATSVDGAPELGLGEPRRGLGLAQLLEMEETDYQNWFRGSPMKRTRREGLRRNAAIAMGNRGRSEYVESLSRALGDPDPVLRQHAVWALGEIDDGAAVSALEAALAVEEDPAAKAEIRAVLRPRKRPPEGPESG